MFLESEISTVNDKKKNILTVKRKMSTLNNFLGLGSIEIVTQKLFLIYYFISTNDNIYLTLLLSVS